MYQNLVRLAVYEFDGTSAITAGTTRTFAATASNGTLSSNEVGEVVALEIDPPVDPATGLAQDIEYVTLDPDGRSTLEDFLRIPARADWNIFARQERLTRSYHQIGGRRFGTIFGQPMVGGTEPPNVLNATAIKFTSKINVKVKAGGSDVDQPFRITVWGQRYLETDISRLMPSILQGPIILRDDERNASKSFQKPPVVVSADTWAALPGGYSQDITTILPFVRIAINSAATTLNKVYTLDNALSQVEDDQHNLFWDTTQEELGVILRQIGVRSGLTASPIYDTSNLGQLYVYAPGYPNHQGSKVPDYGLDAAIGQSEANFGVVFPERAAGEYLVDPLPLFGNTPFQLFDLKGGVAIEDSGAAVLAANDAVVVAAGTFVLGRGVKTA